MTFSLCSEWATSTQSPGVPWPRTSWSRTWPWRRWSMPLSRRTAGWRTIEVTPASHVSIIPPILNNTRLWRSDRPLPGYVLYTSGKSHTMDYQNGSHVSRSASSSPHFIFAVKRSCSKLPRLVVHGPQLPLNPPSSCSFYLPSFPLYHAVPSLSSQTPFFTQNKGPRSQVSLAPPPILSLSLSLSLSVSLSLSFSECHNPWKASALHSSISQKPPI